jgi:hypothetical protein
VEGQIDDVVFADIRRIIQAMSIANWAGFSLSRFVEMSIDIGGVVRF